MKRVLSIILFVALSVPAHADLRYRTRVEVRTASAELKAAMPVGETVMLIRGDAIRVEQVRDATRSVLLIRPDGQFILDLNARTYWRIPDLQSLLAHPATAAPPAFRRTGEFATILGLQAERVEVTISVPLPITPPPGMPATMSMTGEIWVADAYRAYARNISRAIGPSGALPPGVQGIVLRQLVRNAKLGIEIEHAVTELVEAPLAAELFELPEGFRSVIDPAGRP